MLVKESGMNNLIIR